MAQPIAPVLDVTAQEPPALRQYGSNDDTPLQPRPAKVPVLALERAPPNDCFENCQDAATDRLRIAAGCAIVLAGFHKDRRPNSWTCCLFATSPLSAAGI